MVSETNTDQSNPTVAVVIPTYKRTSKLERAVNSVCNQTYTDWELYVVNDAPSHDVSDLLPDDDRISYIQHDENRGAPAARNTGIRVSKSSYIAFLDDDDAWKCRKLERQVEALHKLPDEFGLVYTWRDEIGKNGIKKTLRPRITGDVFNELLQNTFIPSETPLVKRSCFNTVGVFDTSLQSSQDLDMWLRIAKSYKIDVVPESLALSYKGHEDRITTDPKRKYEGTKAIVEKYQKELESNPEAMASKLKKLGVFSAYLGRSQEARRLLIKSCTYKPKQFFTPIYAIITLLPNRIQDPIFSYHRNSL